jgi:hypothetical protein
MPKLFRCENAGCDKWRERYAADAPACPHCGSAEALELVPVHYLYIDPAGAVRTAHGRRTLACQPKAALPLPDACSGERLAVTCPACRATEAFQAHEAAKVSNHVPVIEKKAGVKGQ